MSSDSDSDKARAKASGQRSDKVNRKASKLDWIPTGPTAHVRDVAIDLDALQGKIPNQEPAFHQNLTDEQIAEASADMLCVICLTDVDILHNAALLDGCSHLFHHTCIRKWSKIKNSCPQCRRSFISIERVEVTGGQEELKAAEKAFGGFGLSLGYAFLWNVLQAYTFPVDLIDDICEIKGINSKRARARCEAYRKFVMLQVVSTKSITPSPDVALVWYLHFVQHNNDYHKFTSLIQNAVNVAWKHAFDSAKPQFRAHPGRSLCGSDRALSRQYKACVVLHRNVFGEPVDTIWPSTRGYVPWPCPTLPADPNWSGFKKPAEEEPEAEEDEDVFVDEVPEVVGLLDRVPWCRNMLNKALASMLVIVSVFNLVAATGFRSSLQSVELNNSNTVQCPAFDVRGRQARLGYLTWEYDNGDKPPGDDTVGFWDSRLTGAGIFFGLSSWLALATTTIGAVVLVLTVKAPTPVLNPHEREIERLSTFRRFEKEKPRFTDAQKTAIVVVSSTISWILTIIATIAYQSVMDDQPSDPNESPVSGCGSARPGLALFLIWSNGGLFALVYIMAAALHEMCEPCKRKVVIRKVVVVDGVDGQKDAAGKGGKSRKTKRSRSRRGKNFKEKVPADDGPAADSASGVSPTTSDRSTQPLRVQRATTFSRPASSSGKPRPKSPVKRSRSSRALRRQRSRERRHKRGSPNKTKGLSRASSVRSDTGQALSNTT